MKIHFLNTPLSAFIGLQFYVYTAILFCRPLRVSSFYFCRFAHYFSKIDSKEINQSQTNAIESIDKLNILGYSIKSGQMEVYSTEVAVLTKLLQDEKYNELISFGNSNEGEREFITLETISALTNLSCSLLQQTLALQSYAFWVMK